jgi:hypothetical protein
MNLINATNFVTDYTMATDKDGRESLILVAKGTYGIPAHAGDMPRLLDEQVPLIMTDTFTGEPGRSAPLYEIDFAPRKPRCDVLLNGTCYTPGGRPATLVRVGVRVGSMAKSFNVLGNRVWKSGALSVSASSPEPFTALPLSYNNAYGGVDDPDGVEEAQQWYVMNHSGVGYHPKSPARALAGRALPNTEELARPVTRPDGSYRPMAFGPLGRAWSQRIAWAGTYDQHWLDHRAPFLPDDFDERYFQCAPEDQQTDHLRGGEEVVLINLTASGRTAFHLPSMRVRFEVFYRNEDWGRIDAAVDTLVLEPDRGRFMLTARASVTLRRSLHEVRCVVVGNMPWAWYREQGLRRGPRGKRRFRSLGDLVAFNRTRRGQ